MKKCSSLCLFLLIILPAFINHSCEKLKKDPEFAGTWQFTEDITSNDLVYNTIRTLILSGNSYEETYIIRRENSGSITAIIGTNGELTQARSLLTSYLKELGKCVTDQSGSCTGNVEWFGSGTVYYEDNIGYFETEVTGEFEVTGTTLKLMRDLNNDGDTEDTGEDITFQKI